MPQVTVLMSVYNENERFLRESIRSILVQSFADFEFIIIDDGSTDEHCYHIIKEYQIKDNRIRILRNDKNLGLTVSLNRGLHQAQGAYICRLDSNDLAHPQRLEKQVAFLENHPAYALCGTWSYIINSDDEIIGYKKSPVLAQAIRNKILQFNFFTHSSLCFRKSIFDSLRGYNEALLKAQDYELILRICSMYPTAILPEHLCFYRVLTSSISIAHYKKQERDAVWARWKIFFKYDYHFWEIWKILPATLSFLLVPPSLKQVLITKSWKKN